MKGMHIGDLSSMNWGIFVYLGCEMFIRGGEVLCLVSI